MKTIKPWIHDSIRVVILHFFFIEEHKLEQQKWDVIIVNRKLRLLKLQRNSANATLSIYILIARSKNMKQSGSLKSTTSNYNVQMDAKNMLNVNIALKLLI